MKIAIASSGLGHITRGIETWASDTARALHAHGMDVSLFAAGPCQASIPRTVVLPCLKRTASLNRTLTRLAPRWCWRWHLKSPYDIEQWTFWQHLSKYLQRDHFDILHVQDPFLAACAQTAFAKGHLACRCILAHGTEEPAAWHMLQVRQQLEQRGVPPDTFRHWTALPNFVDTEHFYPFPVNADRSVLRQRLGVPTDAVIWGTAAAIKKHHKRIDWLIREFAAAANQRKDLHLVIAGSRQQDTEALRQMAQSRCPGRITFAVNLPHHEMPELLRALDAFVLTSLFEMMPIALLEAISSGLPAFTHPHPVLEWMAGPGGKTVDMTRPGALATIMQNTPTAALQVTGTQARNHAVQTFAVAQVVPAYIQYYQQIMTTQPRQAA